METKVEEARYFSVYIIKKQKMLKHKISGSLAGRLEGFLFPSLFLIVILLRFLYTVLLSRMWLQAKLAEAEVDYM